MTWEKPFYEDHSVAGEVTAAKNNSIANQLLKVSELVEPPLKTVTQVIGGSGAQEATYGVATEWNTRVPVCLPVSTIRWRLRIRNYRTIANTEEAGGASAKMIAAYLGKPKWTEGRWLGAFTTAPTKVLEEAGAGTAADTFTPWVEAGAQQFTQNQVLALSLSWKVPASAKIFYDATGSTFWTGAGAIAKAAEAPAPGIESGLGTLFDVRLEYEYKPSSSGPRALVGLVIGDSVAEGYSDGTDGGAYICYESWPAVAGLRQGHPITNAGYGGATSTSLTAALTAWRYARLNLTTTVPDYAIIAVGVNDVNVGTTKATYEGNLAYIINQLGEAGVHSVYLATVTPGPWYKQEAGPEAKEKLRTEYNEYLRSMPNGVQGVVDLDRQLTRIRPKAFTEAGWKEAGAEADPAFSSGVENTLHLKRAGYQRMAGALILP